MEITYFTVLCQFSFQQKRNKQTLIITDISFVSTLLIKSFAWLNHIISMIFYKSCDSNIYLYATGHIWMIIIISNNNHVSDFIQFHTFQSLLLPSS